MFDHFRSNFDSPIHPTQLALTSGRPGGPPTAGYVLYGFFLTVPWTRPGHIQSVSASMTSMFESQPFAKGAYRFDDHRRQQEPIEGGLLRLQQGQAVTRVLFEIGGV